MQCNLGQIQPCQPNAKVFERLELNFKDPLGFLLPTLVSPGSEARFEQWDSGTAALVFEKSEHR